MRKLLFFVLLTNVVWSSCKKATVESINTNNSRDSLTYQPSVAGSVWKYTRITSGTFVNNTVTTKLSYDTVANGKTYGVFSSTGDVLGSYHIYNRRDAGKYYQIVPFSTNASEVLVLDTAKAINQTWIGGTNGSDEYSYKIVQIFPTYTLDAFTFRNVYQVYNERKNTNTGNVNASGNTYYAQGVGLIYSDATISGIPGTLKLTNLDLK
jgi:hypothetical protein